MSELDLLLKAYESHVSTPWRPGLSGAEKVWFLVHSPSNERRLRHRLQEFQIATEEARHGWRHLDITNAFSQWLAAQRNRDGFFKNPGALSVQRFVTYLSQLLIGNMGTAGDNDVVAVTGVGSLFGITRLSEIIKSVEGAIRGRMLVCFPGVREENTYRMFESGDGWNYLAIPITAQRVMSA